MKIRFNSLSFLLLILLLVILACEQLYNEGKINLTRIQLQCNRMENCEIDLTKVTDFEWDTLFVFNARATPEEVRRVSSGRATWKDLTSQNYFVHNGTVVYEEHFRYNPEKSRKITFDLGRNNFGVFLSTDKFVLTKPYLEKDHFVLRQK